MLRYKAEEAGCEVVLVNPAWTTQECSQCGSVKKKTLAERWHSCACGASMHRDLNAAINILRRATAGTVECQARGEETSAHYRTNGISVFNEAGSPVLLETKVSREETNGFSD
jgi:putative transposase